MNLGVLLLYCEEGRKTSFTREWAASAIGRVADYMFAQSGGRESITFKVFDWIKLPLTAAQWSALGMGAYSSLRPSLEEELENRGEGPAALTPHNHILIGIDHPASGGGTTTPNVFTYLAATDFTPSFVAHELGHCYRVDDAFRETADGKEIYENQFCVMGAMGWPAVFVDDVLSHPSAPMLNRSGPGMSAPSLMGAKWLNEDEHGLGVDLSSTTLFSSGGRVVELSALTGAPGPAWMRPPVVIRYQDLVVEYRVASPDGWDRGLPDPGPGAGGWVVVHRSSRSAPSAVYVSSTAANPGAVLVLGKDNPLDIFSLGPLKISVLSFNAAARTVRLQFSRRAARQLPSGTIYGGVDVGGGGWILTPGGGIKRIPPHSPLLKVLEQVGRVQELQELLAIASSEEVADLSEETSRALRSLRESVAELRVEPSVSPLAHALESISELHDASERLKSSADDREMTREFVGASREQLREVRRILTNAVEEEHQR